MYADAGGALEAGQKRCSASAGFESALVGGQEDAEGGERIDDDVVGLVNVVLDKNDSTVERLGWRDGHSRTSTHDCCCHTPSACNWVRYQLVWSIGSVANRGITSE